MLWWQYSIILLHFSYHAECQQISRLSHCGEIVIINMQQRFLPLFYICVCSWVCACVRDRVWVTVGVFMCMYALRIVSMDKMLCFINTLIIIRKIMWGMSKLVCQSECIRVGGWMDRLHCGFVNGVSKGGWMSQWGWSRGCRPLWMGVLLNKNKNCFFLGGLFSIMLLF